MVQNSQGPSAQSQTRGTILEWSNRGEQPVALASWDKKVKSNSSEDWTQRLVKQSTIKESISAACTHGRKRIDHTGNTSLSLKQKGRPRNRQGTEGYQLGLLLCALHPPCSSIDYGEPIMWPNTLKAHCATSTVQFPESTSMICADLKEMTLTLLQASNKTGLLVQLFTFKLFSVDVSWPQ